MKRLKFFTSISRLAPLTVALILGGGIKMHLRPMNISSAAIE
jgi:hypothetical protein